MTSTPSILMYGRDQSLLQTRALVLKQAGYRVESVQDWASAQEHRSTDLLILCHTLTQQQRKEALCQAQGDWLQAKKLCLTPTSGETECDFPVFESLRGPKKLIETVGKLLMQVPAR